MQAVIMAGGKGSRISSLVSDMPKPMIPICNKPILQYQIECLKKQKIIDIILVVGYMGNIIKDYFKDGRRFGVNISYISEKEALGTAGALYFLKDIINEDFLLINGDIVFDIDFNRFLVFHRKQKGIATIFTHPNGHPYDSGIVITDKDSIVTNWLYKEDNRMYYKNRVNAGIHILSPQIFNMFTELKKVDLDREILKLLIPTKKLVAYDSPEYVKDMGTPDRYHIVINDLKNGYIQAKNLINKQKAIFLDRDGTINKYKGFISKADDFELIEGVTEAIKKINNSDYLAIVITNQPVIARGECTIDELEVIHMKLETLLGEHGAYIDDIFYCPHHPDKGFAGERIDYKIQCDCRKPKAGLLYKAAKKYNIDLEQSFMIGDDYRDIEAGKNAGCKTERITKEFTLMKAIRKILED